uniref:CTCHY-type domain-containing protein n=1 Tax=Syphacia muris TaxID=451379 RepID=A0A0N5ADZ7_9BILA
MDFFLVPASGRGGNVFLFYGTMKEKHLGRKAGRFGRSKDERYKDSQRPLKSKNFISKSKYQRNKQQSKSSNGKNLKLNKSLREPDVSLRDRAGFCYVEFPAEDTPHCPHGPCILLGLRSPSGNIVDRNFVCAVYRGGECSFRCPVSDDGKIDADVAISATKNNASTSKKKIIYNNIWKSIKELSTAKEELYYCKWCNDVKSSAHFHELVGPIKKSIFRNPSKLFSFDSIDSSKAQFWFSDDSLKVLEDVRTTNNFDGVLCIGTPTVFEFMRKTAERRQSINSFLLDLDGRFAAFYRSTQFAQYSMLVNYFYDPFGEAKLKEFFASVKKLMVICDPPFGVILDPLIISLKNLRSCFKEMDKDGSKQFNVILTLPYFLGKFLRLADPPLEMSDFAVCYENHPKFSQQSRSPVRFFTDIPLAQFPILLDGYRFCDMCERYVAEQNRHCGLCGVCPSKNGKTYRHCELCNRCIRPNYKHCKKCSRCHFPGRCLQR